MRNAGKSNSNTQDLEQSESQVWSIGQRISWIGLVGMVTLVFLRALIEHEPFPWWGADPFVFAPPITGLTPKWAMMLNLGIVFSGIITLIGLLKLNHRVHPMSVIGIGIALFGIGYHSLQSIEQALDATNLLAILTVFYIATCAHKLEHAQGFITSIGLGFVTLLVIIGVYEVYVAHPSTIADYQLHKQAFLQARGWAEGSFEVLAYERRLNQPEPIAWFGLSNVYASFVGAGAVGFSILTFHTRKTKRWVLIFGICAIVSIFGLLMSKSKGGLGAALLGLIVSFVLVYSPIKIKSGRIIVCSTIFIVIGLLIRGMIGEQLSELSLLFRSQYLQGATRIFGEHPFAGVGPSSFQDAYSLYKPELSPEDVSSAHNLIFDLGATLGISGLIFASIIFHKVSSIQLPETLNGTSSDSNENNSAPLPRTFIQLLALVITLGSVISIRVGSPAMNVELLMTQLIASLIWGGITIYLFKQTQLESLFRFISIVIASVLLFHSMIEVSGTWIVSGLLWALLLGIAYSPTTSQAHDSNQDPDSNSSSIGSCGLIGLFGISAIIVGIQIAKIIPWEQSLTQASLPAQEIAYLRSLDDLQSNRNADQLEFEGRQLALEHLEVAIALRPTHLKTSIAGSEQCLWLAAAHQSMGDESKSIEYWDHAIDLSAKGVDQAQTGIVSGYRWLASVYLGRVRAFPDSESIPDWYNQARLALEKAHALSPHDPHIALRILNIGIQTDDDELIQVWAQRTKALHVRTRLDPLRGISESDLKRIQQILTPSS